MAFWNRKKPATRRHAPNPHRNNTRSFYSGNVDRLLANWTTSSSSIDAYLRTDLTSLRARSRELVRLNEYGKKYIAIIKGNIVGPVGVVTQARVKTSAGEFDKAANDAIETAFKDWADFYCDYEGRSTWIDLQNIAISCAGQDGEFIFRKHRGPRFGPYGLQLQTMDPELLDATKNEDTPQGGAIRLGVEYNSNGRVVRYWFRELDNLGNYNAGRSYSIAASEIIHGFVTEWPNQSRGVPWMHAGLQTAKHASKYDESAIVAARAGASNALVLSDKGEPDPAYSGDEAVDDESGNTYQNLEPGEIFDAGQKEVNSWDPTYPHQLYDAFSKSLARRFSAGVGASYHSITNDLSSVNFSSIRSGVLEDREIFKGLQGWFIRQLIAPVYRDFVVMAMTTGQIKILGRDPARPVRNYLPAHYQGRRWDWVDPQKDSAANQNAIDSRLKSRSQIIRDQGNDPDTVFAEIAEENKKMKELGITPEQSTTTQPNEVLDNET